MPRKKKIEVEVDTDAANAATPTDDRPKTPYATETKTDKSTSQHVDELMDAVHRLEVSGGTNPVKKPRAKKQTPPSDGIVRYYLCVTCDKEYKSKAGLRKHAEKCGVLP